MMRLLRDAIPAVVFFLINMRRIVTLTIYLLSILNIQDARAFYEASGVRKKRASSEP